MPPAHRVPPLSTNNGSDMRAAPGMVVVFGANGLFGPGADPSGSGAGHGFQLENRGVLRALRRSLASGSEWNQSPAGGLFWPTLSEIQPELVFR